MLPRDDLLIQHSSSTTWELVIPHLLLSRVGCDVVPQQLRLLRCDDTHVHVASTAQIVPDTSLNCISAKLHCVLTGHVLLPRCLEDGHGGERSRSHGDVWELVGGSVCVNSEEVSACRVASSDNEVCADVSLISEEVLLEESHDSNHTGLAACGERMELEVGGDDGGCEFGISSSSCTCTPDLRGDVVELLAVLRVMR